MGLVVLAVVLVTAAGFVTFSEEPALDPEEVFPEVVVINPDKRPEFIFPEAIRTFDLSLNRFVDRFARVCMQGKYSEFRLMLSQRLGDPIVASSFESMFNAVKRVRILALEKLPDVPGLNGPVYIMLAEYDLEDYAATRGRQTEQRRLAIFKEEGQWRIGPVPHDALAKLDALRNPVTQPALVAPTEPGRRSVEHTPLDPPMVSANRPARIGP